MVKMELVRRIADHTPALISSVDQLFNPLGYLAACLEISPGRFMRSARIEIGLLKSELEDPACVLVAVLIILEKVKPSICPNAGSHLLIDAKDRWGNAATLQVIYPCSEQPVLRRLTGRLEPWLVERLWVWSFLCTPDIMTLVEQHYLIWAQCIGVRGVGATRH
jgi:hypothetical protein